MLAISGEAHLARRKWWNRAFNTAALKGYEHIISRRAEQLADLLVHGADGNVTVNLSVYFSWFT